MSNLCQILLCFEMAQWFPKTEIRDVLSSPAFIHSSSIFKLIAWLEVDNSETQYHGLIPVHLTEYYFVQWLETKGIHFLFVLPLLLSEIHICGLTDDNKMQTCLSTKQKFFDICNYKFIALSLLYSSQ